MINKRREILITLATIPIVVAGCSSDGDSTVTPAEGVPPVDPVGCDEISPFTPLEVVQNCGNLLDEESSEAQALQYESVSSVAGQICATCSLYLDSEDSVSGACSLFPGRLVPAGAWCLSYRRG